ncbi:MAG: hypothetical protein IPH44_01275 [Myxococcales bacterium]|nr:hypothetical protein [Myxococcales bacterium]MBK7197946.1 hypothetical protein [Myxococcales bacterium]
MSLFTPLVDASRGSPGAQAPAPQTTRAGAGPTTRSLPPPATAQSTLQGLPVAQRPGDTTHDQQQLKESAARLQRLARDVQAGRPIAGDLVLLASSTCEVAAGAAYHLAMAQAQAETEAARRDGDADSPNPFVAGRARREQEAEAQRAQATAWRDADVEKHLDAIATAAMAIMRSVGHDGTRIANALKLLAMAAAPLGWELPHSVEDGTARERAHEPCDTDAATGADAVRDNPTQCYMSESDRAGVARQMNDALKQLRAHFTAAIQRHTKKLQAAIDRDQKMAEQVANMVLDALITAATAGLGKGASKAAATAGATAAEQHAPAAIGNTKKLADYSSEFGKASKGMKDLRGLHGAAASVPGELATLARKVATDAVKSTIKNSRTIAASDDKMDPRYKQVGFAEGLEAATGESLEGLAHDLERLDDATLDELTIALREITPADLDKQLAPIMAAFASQVQPIGDTRYSPDLITVRRHTKKAARIKLPTGKTAYALVTYSDDVLPEDTQAQRLLGATLRDAGRRLDGGDVMDGVTSKADYANALQPNIEVEFIRWITNPKGTNIDFQGMVDGEAVDVPLSKLKDRPFVDPDGNLLDG